jgi:acetone carboxylase gamma subunit
MEKEQLHRLIDGALSTPELKDVIIGPKDPERFQTIREVYQERLGWTEPVLMRLSDHLYIVSVGENRVVRCSCGHDFGDYRENWKRGARIYTRDTDEAQEEIYSRLTHADPQWMVLREFYCPGCFTQLEVEAVPPGYPLVHDFVPDLDAIEEWTSTTS